MTVVCGFAFTVQTSFALVTIKEGDFEFAVYDTGKYRLYSYSGSEKDIVLPDKVSGMPVTGIYDNCFNGSDIESVVIPESYESIGTSAFLNCSSLTSVNIPSNIKSIGITAFANCSSLKNIDLSAIEMTTLPYGIFMNNSSLASVKLPRELVVISDSAFLGCSALEEIELPFTVEKIENNAFKNNSSLREIYLPVSIESIGQDALSPMAENETVEIVCSYGSYAEEFCKENGIKNIKAIRLGDANLDGDVNVKDVTFVQKCVAGLSNLSTYYNLIYADTNFDDSLTVRDATLIQMLIAGIITEF